MCKVLEGKIEIKEKQRLLKYLLASFIEIVYHICVKNLTFFQENIGSFSFKKLWDFRLF